MSIPDEQFTNAVVTREHMLAHLHGAVETWKELEANPERLRLLEEMGQIGSGRSIVTYGTTKMWFKMVDGSDISVEFHDTERIICPEPHLPPCFWGYLISGPVKITIGESGRSIYWEYGIKPNSNPNPIYWEYGIKPRKYQTPQIQHSFCP